MLACVEKHTSGIVFTSSYFIKIELVIARVIIIYIFNVESLILIKYVVV